MARGRPLQCPFCDTYLVSPRDIEFKSMELTGGICPCGAIYALDRTGHNLGEIYLEALTFLCRGNIDKALSLTPEEYDSVDMDYNIHAQTIGRDRSKGKTGKLIFLRLIEGPEK